MPDSIGSPTDVSGNWVNCKWQCRLSLQNYRFNKDDINKVVPVNIYGRFVAALLCPCGREYIYFVYEPGPEFEITLAWRLHYFPENLKV